MYHHETAIKALQEHDKKKCALLTGSEVCDELNCDHSLLF